MVQVAFVTEVSFEILFGFIQHLGASSAVTIPSNNLYSDHGECNF